jgi:hypothetical protein
VIEELTSPVAWRSLASTRDMSCLSNCSSFNNVSLRSCSLVNRGPRSNWIINAIW